MILRARASSEVGCWVHDHCYSWGFGDVCNVMAFFEEGDEEGYFDLGLDDPELDMEFRREFRRVFGLGEDFGEEAVDMSGCWGGGDLCSLHWGGDV